MHKSSNYILNFAFAMVLFLTLKGQDVQAQTLISTVFGTGSTTGGSTGDGAAATSALMLTPQNLYVNNAGDIWICDYGNNKIRKYTASTGFASTVAGTGASGATGDGAAATAALLNHPIGICMNSVGDIFFTDSDNHKIRKIDHTNGFISTYAGTGTAGSTGDGGVATSAKLSAPKGLCVDASNNLYIADEGNDKLRKITFATGIITTLAGTGSPGSSGDGGLATAAKLNAPFGVQVASNGDIYICDTGNDKIRKINIGTGNISTYAGTGSPGFVDNITKLSAQFANIRGIAMDANDNIYIADDNNERIRKITFSSGMVSTVAGIGGAATNPHTGNGGVATAANTGPSRGVAVNSTNLYFTEFDNHSVRMVQGIVTPLPVQLIDFVVKEIQNKIQLSWKTTLEENSKCFHIMRSEDGINFDKIGVVPAKGHSSTIVEYHYTDFIPYKKGIYYYKLIENDIDEKSQESKIVVMSFENRTNVHFFPNPNFGKAAIFFHSIDGGTYTINILNHNGQVMYSQEFVGERGENEFDVNMEHFPQGVYHVQFNGLEYNFAVLKVLKKT